MKVTISITSFVL